MKYLLSLFVCLVLAGCGSLEAGPQRYQARLMYSYVNTFRDIYYGETKIDDVVYSGIFDNRPNFPGSYCFSHIQKDGKTTKVVCVVLEDKSTSLYRFVREDYYKDSKLVKSTAPNRLVKRSEFDEYENNLFKSLDRAKKISLGDLK